MLIYLTIVGAKERGYAMMPRVEETLAGYLSPGSSSSLKKSVLPTKPCRLTSLLVFQAAGQAGATLQTMAVLQAYQANLLKDLSMSHRFVSSCNQANGLFHRLF